MGSTGFYVPSGASLASRPMLARFVRTYMTPESWQGLEARGVHCADDFALFRGIEASLPTSMKTQHALSTSSDFSCVALAVKGLSGPVLFGKLAQTHIYPAPRWGDPGFHDQSYHLSGWYFAGPFGVEQLRARTAQAQWYQQSSGYPTHRYEASATCTTPEGVVHTMDLLAPSLFALVIDPLLTALPPDTMTASMMRLLATHTAYTSGGTIYYFRDRELLGYGSSQDRIYPPPLSHTGYASHAAILARQGRMRVTQETGASQNSAPVDALRHARAAIEGPLEDAAFRPYTSTSLPESVRDLSWMLDRRVATWNQLCHTKAGEHTKMRPAAIRSGCPGNRGLTLAERLIRYLWLPRMGRHGEGKLFWVQEDGLTHYQMLLVLLGTELANTELHKAKHESFVAQEVRGGMLKIEYDVDGKIERLSLPKWGVAFPGYHRGATASHPPLLLSDADILTLEEGMRSGVHGVFL